MSRSAIHRLLIIAVFGTAVAIICANAQTGDNWISVRSKNFRIAGNAPEIDLRSAANRLEEFRWAFARLYPQLKLDNGRPTQIVIFKDAASYSAYLPKRPDDSPDEGVAGYFQSGEDINYITFAAAAGGENPFSTAVHEYVHSIIDSNFDGPNLPPWLNEGLAEYFETVHVEGGKSITVGGQQNDHLRLLRRSGPQPLSDLFAVDAAALRTMSTDRRRSFYAQSWAVVHFLMQSGRLSFNALPETLSKLAARDSPESAFAKTFGIDHSRLETELNLDIQKMILPTASVAVSDPVPTNDAPIIESLSPARSAALLGDLLFHTGDIARAETFLRQSLAVDRELPLANAALGLVLMRQEKPAEAKPFLEKAIAAGITNHLVYFNYAYSTSREFTRNGSISELPDNAAGSMRTALKRATELAPNYTESYRLLALVDFIRDENLEEAVGLIKKGLSLRKGDVGLELLLARILLRREDAAGAKQIAERIAETPVDTKQKNDADEIVKAAYEYIQAKAAAPPPMRLTFSYRPQLVVLKRSWLTDADLARIEDERINNNINRVIIRQLPGEQQVVGRIERVACDGNEIVYTVSSGSALLNLTGADFSGLKMTVAREGESTFQIGCGARLEKELTVLNYRPGTDTVKKTAGELVAVSFVPDGFRLKSLNEMSAARMVAVDDDTLRRPSTQPVEINADTIHRSILQNLRKPRKGEERFIGTIEKVDCATGKTVFQISAGGRLLKLVMNLPGEIEVGWFTVASSQLSLSCGGGPVSATVIAAFRPSAVADGTDGELRSLEFVPDGFIL